MVVSTEKPKQIYIFDIRDDIKKGKTLVKYAFRYNIESTIMEHENGSRVKLFNNHVISLPEQNKLSIY